MALLGSPLRWIDEQSENALPVGCMSPDSVCSSGMDICVWSVFSFMKSFISAGIAVITVISFRV